MADITQHTVGVGQGRAGESGHSSCECGERHRQRGSRELWEVKEEKARQRREDPALHVHPLQVRCPGGLSSPVLCFLDLRMGFSLRSRYK